MRAQSLCAAFAIVLLCPFASAQWVKINGPSGVDVTCVALSGPNFFAGTYGNGVYLSTNNGANWTAVNAGLPYNTYVNALAVNEATLYAGTVSGVFVSTDNGTSWSATTGMTYRNVHAFAVSGSNLFAATWDDGVYRSTDDGASWTAANAGLTMHIAYSLATSDTNLFVGLDEGAGVFRSTNNGTSWIAARSGLTNGTVPSLAISGNNLFAGTSEGVFLSTDNGTHWTAVNTGVPVDSYGLYPIVSALAVSGTNVFAAAYGAGVFLSTNNGTSWTDVNAGLGPYTIILAVGGANLYAGSHSVGVWFRPLSEMVTTSVSEPPRELPTAYRLQQNYPNPFNPSTTIKYELPKASHVHLNVYDILGRQVSVLVDERRDAGVHEVKFSGACLAGGVYFYRLSADEFVQTIRLLLVR